MISKYVWEVLIQFELDAMTTEATCVTESAGLPDPTELSMSPSQALTTRFEIDTSEGEGQVELKTRGTGGTSFLGRAEARQGFRVGELRLMIRYEDGSELSEVPALHRLPNAPEWFCGIANLHGKLIPVFDLANYWKVSPIANAKRMLLVLSRGANATGVLIDGLPERLRLNSESLAEEAALSPSLEGLVHGTYWVTEQSWVDLHVDALLGQIEQKLVRDVGQVEL